MCGYFFICLAFCDSIRRLCCAIIFNKKAGRAKNRPRSNFFKKVLLLKLYLDIYLAVNFTVDFFLLCLTGRTMRMSARVVRLLGAAAIGAAAAAFSLLFSLSFPYIPPIPYTAFTRRALSLICTLLTPAAMLFAAFGKMPAIRFLQSYVILFGTSFAAGGIFSALSQHFPIMLQPKTLFAASFAVFFFCFFFFDIFSFSSDTEVVNVIVGYKNREKRLRLLCDSGCLVREPIGGLPVILLSPKSFDSIYPPEEYETPEAAVRLGKRLVPLKTAAGSTLISAVMPEKLYIESRQNAKQKRTVLPMNLKADTNGSALKNGYREKDSLKNKQATPDCAPEENSVHGRTATVAMIGRSNTDSFAGLDGIFPKALLR